MMTRSQASLKGAASGVEAELQPAPVGALGPLASEGQALPVFATLDGVAVAVLPLADYKRLVAAAMQDARAAIVAAAQTQPKRKPRGLSTIERDPEVAEFLLEGFRGGVTIQQIRDACRNTFGEERTPSHTRIQRFRERLQGRR